VSWIQDKLNARQNSWIHLERTTWIQNVNGNFVLDSEQSSWIQNKKKCRAVNLSWIQDNFDFQDCIFILDSGQWR
jgi:hypothetical protein